MKFSVFLLLISFIFCFSSCKQSEQTANSLMSGSMDSIAPKSSKTLPDWAKNANVYEVNIRQYTKEGTFKAFAEHLPRLKKMGVDILTLMPVFPISKTKRKGELGSYYAVADFNKVNPDFGTMADFRALIQKIHSLDMHVVLEWVPNYTGWDHQWIKQKPEYYLHDTKTGAILNGRGYKDSYNNKNSDWSDAAALNYSNQEMRQSMIKSMKYWIATENVDGYLLDGASGVQSDFWDEATAELYKIKPIFLIPDSNKPSKNFDISYGWDWYHLMNDIAIGDKKAIDIDKMVNAKANNYSRGFTMLFTSNHEENSRNGSELERMKDGYKALAVFAATFDGMPLIYSGQEEPLIKRLEVTKKDEIKWGSFQNAEMYSKLLDLKHRNKALWNGEYGGRMQRIENGNENVYSFVRIKDGDKVVVIINLSDLPQNLQLADENIEGVYSSVFSNTTLSLTADMEMKLKPWEYIVLEKE